jgi:tripartite-type tricarboxylate transporter receptor subunit TctC
MPQAEAGRVIPLVVVGKDRFPLAPDVPALGESGIDVDVVTHFAFYAPKGTPAPIVSKLTTALSDASMDPGFKQAMDATRTRVELLPADALARVLADEQARFAPLIATLKMN